MNYFYDIFEDQFLGTCIRETSYHGKVHVWDLNYLFDKNSIIQNDLKKPSFLRSKNWIFKNRPELLI